MIISRLIDKNFSEYEEEKLYSVLMDEDELRLYSEFLEEREYAKLLGGDVNKGIKGAFGNIKHMLTRSNRQKVRDIAAKNARKIRKNANNLEAMAWEAGPNNAANMKFVNGQLAPSTLHSEIIKDIGKVQEATKYKRLLQNPHYTSKSTPGLRGLQGATNLQMIASKETPQKIRELGNQTISNKGVFDFVNKNAKKAGYNPMPSEVLKAFN